MESKSKQVSASVIVSLRTALEYHECPYLHMGEDWWVSELLFDPGEYRKQLLTWILEQFDPKTKEILEDTGMSKEQRILQVMTEMGFCKRNEMKLITGHASVQRQVSFWKLLVQVLPEKKAEDTLLPKLIDDNDEDCNLEKKYQFIDCLADGQELQKIFNPRVCLIPQDISRELHRQGNKTFPVPQIEHLKMLLCSAHDQLNSLQDTVDKLQAEESLDDLSDTPHFTQEEIDSQVKVVTAQLCHLMTAFSSCYYTEFQTWINRQGEGPQLTELGTMFQRIEGNLSSLTKFLNDLHSLNSSFHKLRNITEMREGSRKTTVNSVTQGSLFQCTGLIDTIQGIVNILDDMAPAETR